MMAGPEGPPGLGKGIIMGGGKTGLFYAGAIIAVVGVLMLLASQAPLGLYAGTGVTIIGVVLVGMGLRRRLKEKNPALADIILIGALIAAVALAVLGFFTG
jgi:hypothetical protein